MMYMYLGIKIGIALVILWSLILSIKRLRKHLYTSHDHIFYRTILGDLLGVIDEEIDLTHSSKDKHELILEKTLSIFLVILFWALIGLFIFLFTILFWPILVVFLIIWGAVWVGYSIKTKKQPIDKSGRDN